MPDNAGSSLHFIAGEQKKKLRGPSSFIVAEGCHVNLRLVCKQRAVYFGSRRKTVPWRGVPNSSCGFDGSAAFLQGLSAMRPLRQRSYWITRGFLSLSLSLKQLQLRIVLMARWFTDTLFFVLFSVGERRPDAEQLIIAEICYKVVMVILDMSA